MILKPKQLIFFCLVGLGLFNACQPSPKNEAAGTAPDFINTPYWLSSSFLDAVAADSDTMGWANCMELQFRFKDSVLIVNCESDAMLEPYKVIDDKTIEIIGGFGDEKPRIMQVGDGELELSGLFDNQKVRFKPVNHPDRDPRGLSIRYLGEHLAGTYTSKSNAATSITLSGDGKVKGLGTYNKFETAIGGGLAATDKGNMIYFYSDKGELPLVWQKRGDTLTLWKLKNVSAPDEVPWYELNGEYEVWVRK